MRIDKYINDLLFLHDCVIIADFGGFVAHYRPSYLHKDYHTISPPAKVIAFNKELRENDGLLANYLCKQLNINYKSACDAIAAFAALATEELESGKIFKIEHIGQFEYDKEKNLQFKADPESNFLISSFGLSVVHSPVIKRDQHSADTKAITSIKKKPKKKKTVAVPKKKEKRKKNPVFALVEVVPVAAIMLLLLFKPGYVDKLNEKVASIIPLTNNFDANWTNNTANNSNDQNKVEHNLGSVFINDSNDAFTDESDTIDQVVDQWDNESEPENNNVTDDNSEGQEEAESWSDENNIVDNNDTKEEDTSESEIVNANTDIKTVAEPVQADNAAIMNSKYYIIGGCFGVKSNADKFLVKLQSEGFPAAIAAINARGLHMVAFDGAATLSEATSKLDGIRAKSYPSAWIYRP